MTATFINVALVLLGSALGLLFQNHISQRFMTILTMALGLCVAGIGISSLVSTQDTLCVIVCMVVGSLIGEAVDIERRLEGAGDLIRTRLIHSAEGSRFTEGFVTASLLFCVGAMAITGSIEAGLNHNWSIIVSKGVIDGVTAISFAATMGVGVVFSAVPLLVYQGAITLFAGFLSPLISGDMLNGICMVGYAIVLCIGINFLEFTDIRTANLLPAIFLPILYVPLSGWLTQLVG